MRFISIILALALIFTLGVVLRASATQNQGYAVNINVQGIGSYEGDQISFGDIYWVMSGYSDNHHYCVYLFGGQRGK